MWLKKNISQEFRLKNIDETRNYLIEEINRNELMSKKHKKVGSSLNYIEHFLNLRSKITGCVSISDLAFLAVSYRNYEFCSCIKNLCNNSSNRRI